MSVIDETLNAQKIIKTFKAKGFFTNVFVILHNGFLNFLTPYCIEIIWPPVE